MTTGTFLRRYAYVYLYTVGVMVLLAFWAGGNPAIRVNSPQDFLARPVPVIDAGHGGIDGGTTSCTGIPESRINLQISGRLEVLLKLLGYEPVMTRSGEDSLATEGSTIREQKRSDLRNRIGRVSQVRNPVLVSIHQNFYPDSRYSGAQVFYNRSESAKRLARDLQNSLNEVLKPETRRSSKPVQKVYLMDHVSCPGILLECGFLSNPEEEQRLRDPGYQKKLCTVVAAELARYIESPAAKETAGDVPI